MKPIVIGLFCGLGGWSRGFLAEGYQAVGFDVERHQYDDKRYPAQLVLQDVLTLHGSQFCDVAAIVASPPCQAYSYRAMPWKRAKALPPPSNELFDACFRIQREACEAAGRHIPMVVENVKGAQPWVGRARWHYGSFYLWGDVPALMPSTRHRESNALKGCGDWFSDPANPFRYFKPDGVKQQGSGATWFDIGIAARGSQTSARKAASAMIAEIPLDLAQHIASVFKPLEFSRSEHVSCNFSRTGV